MNRKFVSNVCPAAGVSEELLLLCELDTELLLLECDELLWLEDEWLLLLWELDTEDELLLCELLEWLDETELLDELWLDELWLEETELDELEWLLLERELELEL